MSEIIKIDENNYLATSMKFKSFYPFTLTNENLIKDIEKITIGERIRDIIYYDEKIYLFLEDTASVGILKKK